VKREKSKENWNFTTKNSFAALFCVNCHLIEKNCYI